MVIKGYDVWPLLKKTGKEIGEDKVAVYASQMAYSFFFSLFPLLLVAASLLGLVVDRQTVMSWFSGRVAAALPGDVASLLGKTIGKVVSAEGAPGLLSFGIVAAAWSGSAIFGTFMDGLNAAYEVEENRPWWKRQLLRLGMLAVSGVILLAATVILLNGEGVTQWLGARLGLGRAAVMVWTAVQFPLAIAFVVGLLWLQYYFLPNRRARSKSAVLAGAVVATVLWLAATLLFRLYVQSFHKMNEAYGAIGAIMVLLTWMYYSSFVLLASGELASELEQGTGRAAGGQPEEATYRREPSKPPAATAPA